MTFMIYFEKPNRTSYSDWQRKQNIAMEDCSFITATYSVGVEQLGSIAILGPTRMEYSRVISLMQVLAKDLSTVLTELYQTK